jgi:hypothetical protein
VTNAIIIALALAVTTVCFTLLPGPVVLLP